jgi:hypothetical protein
MMRMHGPRLWATRQRQQPIAEGFLDVVAAVQGMLERVEPAMIPIQHEFIGAAREHGDVDPDLLGLPDAVEAPDALLDQARD